MVGPDLVAADQRRIILTRCDGLRLGGDGGGTFALAHPRVAGRPVQRVEVFGQQAGTEQAVVERHVRFDDLHQIADGRGAVGGDGVVERGRLGEVVAKGKGGQEPGAALRFGQFDGEPEDISGLRLVRTRMMSFSSAAIRMSSNWRKKPPTVERLSPRSLRISTEKAVWRLSGQPKLTIRWALSGLSETGVILSVEVRPVRL